MKSRHMTRQRRILRVSSYFSRRMDHVQNRTKIYSTPNDFK